MRYILTLICVICLATTAAAFDPPEDKLPSTMIAQVGMLPIAAGGVPSEEPPSTYFDEGFEGVGYETTECGDAPCVTDDVEGTAEEDSETQAHSGTQSLRADVSGGADVEIYFLDTTNRSAVQVEGYFFVETATRNLINGENVEILVISETDNETVGYSAKVDLAYADGTGYFVRMVGGAGGATSTSRAISTDCWVRYRIDFNENADGSTDSYVDWDTDCDGSFDNENDTFRGHYIAPDGYDALYYFLGVPVAGPTDDVEVFHDDFVVRPQS